MPLQSINLYSLLAKKKQFKKTVNFDLKRIKLALSKLGNPEKKLKNVIIFEVGFDNSFSPINFLKALFSLKRIIKNFWNRSVECGNV